VQESAETIGNGCDVDAIGLQLYLDLARIDPTPNNEHASRLSCGSKAMEEFTVTTHQEPFPTQIGTSSCDFVRGPNRSSEGTLGFAIDEGNAF